MEMALPATAMEPKLFTADWIKILARQNTAPCSPAGSPMDTIFPTNFPEKQKLSTDNRISSVSRISHQTTIPAENRVERSVATATPATPSPHTMTKNRFRPTLIKPENVRIRNGLRLSPLERRIAEPKS